MRSVNLYECKAIHLQRLRIFGSDARHRGKDELRRVVALDEFHASEGRR